MSLNSSAIDNGLFLFTKSLETQPTTAPPTSHLTKHQMRARHKEHDPKLAKKEN